MIQNPVDAYMASLKSGFYPGRAPDGTTVISTPFRYISGDPIELALWQENGRPYVGDRGRLIDALSLVGLDPLENEASLSRIRSASVKHGGYLDEGTIVMPVDGDLGRAMGRLLQTIMDLQTVGYEEHKEIGPEPAAYDMIRDVLHRHDARYREHTEVGGCVGRRYEVDFLFAVEGPGKPVRSVVVVATRHQTLAFAERWNFRFRDIHLKLPKLRRIVVVDATAPWTDAASRTMGPECDGVFRVDRGGAIDDFVQKVALSA